MMPAAYGPNTRPDANPLHDNLIRRFREELRLGRPEFAKLLDVKVDTLRVWEGGQSKPRGESAMRIVEVASRNDYPLTVQDIFKAPMKPKVVKKKSKKKKK